MAQEQQWITLAGTLVELVAAVVVAYHVFRALRGIVQGQSSDEARLRIAEGVLSALGFSLAGTLLKTIGLRSWEQIRMFAFIYLLRQVLKHVFLREERCIRKRMWT